MADKTIRDAFGDIADAIRSKGVEGTMTPLEMPAKIDELPSKSDYEEVEEQRSQWEDQAVYCAGYITESFVAVEEKGGTFTTTEPNELPDAIRSIPSGGSSGYTVHINSVASSSRWDSTYFRLYFDDDRQQSYMVYITWGYRSNYCGLSQEFGQSRQVLVNIDQQDKTIDYAWYGVKAIKFYGNWGGEINGVHYDEGEVVTLTEDSNIGGHYYTCLKYGTPITMADGSTKKVEELELGDEVRSINPDTNQVETDVVTYVDGAGNHSAYGWDEWKFDDGTTISTVNPHRFFNVEKQKMVYMYDWNIGEHARKEDGTEVKLVEHIRHNEIANHSTLFTQKWNNYFANGLLSGNRRSAALNI